MPTYNHRSPQVSVIMGVFNGGQFLHEAIQSILNQSYRDFEFLIIDDGSTDQTPNILGSFSDSRIIIERNPINIGLTKSLNKALQKARGKYISRQDADDISFPDRLARQVAFLDSYPECSMAGSHAALIDEHGTDIGTIEPSTDTQEINTQLIKFNLFIHGAITARKSAIIDVGGYRDKFTYAQDYDLWLRMHQRYLLANLPESLYCLRRLSHSISMTRFDRQLAFAFVARAFCMERSQTGLDNYEELDPDNPENFLARRFPNLLPDLKEEKHRACRAYIEESLKLGKRQLARYWLQQALANAPSMSSHKELRKMMWLDRWSKLEAAYLRHIGWRLRASHREKP